MPKSEDQIRIKGPSRKHEIGKTRKRALESIKPSSFVLSYLRVFVIRGCFTLYHPRIPATKIKILHHENTLQLRSLRLCSGSVTGHAKLGTHEVGRIVLYLNLPFLVLSIFRAFVIGFNIMKAHSMKSNGRCQRTA